MKSPRRSKVLIPGKAWLAMKPYTRFTSYDQYYINLASAILQEYKQFPELSDKNFEIPNVAETLALVLTSYMEDVINQIGIWQAFTEANKEQLGYYLPFIDEEDEPYEPGVFDFRDLHYLVWHFFNKAKDTFFTPDSNFINLLADIAWEVMEPAFDDAPETAFYEAYLAISDDTPFFELKERLHWFAIKSYVLQFEFGPALKDTYKELIEKNPHLVGAQAILYQLMDEYAFSEPSSYGGLTVPQWLASVAGVSPEMKTQMFNLRNRLAGFFQYLGSTDAYHQVRPAHSSETLDMTKASIEIPPKTKAGDWLFMTLVSYWGEFWMSGMMANYGQTDEQELAPPKLPFAMRSKHEQELAWEHMSKMEEDFRAEFGDLVYISTDSEDLKTRMGAFWLRNAAENPDMTPPLDESMLNAMYEGLPQTPGTAVVFVSGEGLLFDPGAGETLNLLRQPGIADQKTRNDLFNGLLNAHPVSLAHLLREVPGTPVWFPSAQSQFDMRPYLEFLSRYVQPELYLPRVPNMKMTENPDD